MYNWQRMIFDLLIVGGFVTFLYGVSQRELTPIPAKK